MKACLFVIFAAIVSFSTVSNAWKEVGNAAGISEQNLIYAMRNGEGLLFNAGKILTSESDKAFFAEFLAELGNSQLEFNYDQNEPRVFSVQGNTWILYSNNLMIYDLDTNGVLSLKESYKLLLEVFAFKKGYRSEQGNNSVAFQEFEDNLLNIFGASEKTLILKTYGEELQWTELPGVYHLFFADKEPLQLTESILQPRLCTGDLTNLRLRNPALTSVQKREAEIRLLVTVDSYFECDGQTQTKRLMLDLSANEQEAQLKLR